jgi:ADP-heptose:LPS heptosyltransferase
MTHVLAVRLDNDGDVLLAGPAVRALAAGADRVTVLCGPRGRRAAELLPGVDELVVWRAPWIDPEPDPVARGEIEALAGRLAALGLDAAVIFGSFHQSPLPTALVLRMAGVPFVAATSADYPGSLLDVRHRISDDVHEVERALDLAAAAGFPLPAGDDGALRIRRDAAAAAGTWLDAAEEAVVVHPGASVPARAWAPERNAELVGALADGGRRVVVTGGPAERDLTAMVAGPPRPEVRDLGGRLSLAELAEVLAAARCVVVGNTGPAHLAAAVGTPVVSLFAPTIPPVRWRPWRVPHELLFVDVPCAGCRARVCPIAGHPCLGGVATGDVLDAVERLAPVGVAA